MNTTSKSVGLTLDVFGTGVALCSLIFLFFDCTKTISVLLGIKIWSGHVVTIVPAVMGAYALAHLLRATRLWLIVGTDRLAFSAVFGCHVTLALCTFAIPFKVGDLLRATELVRLLKNDPRGVFAVWLDRLFDVAVILILLVAFCFSGYRSQGAVVVLLSLSLFLTFSILLGILLPGSVVAFMRALLQSSSKRSLRVIRATVKLRSLLSTLPKLDLQTLSLLSMVTFTIWGLELLAVFLVLLAMPDSAQSLADQAVDALKYALVAQPTPKTMHVALHRSICIATIGIMAAFGIKAYARGRIARPRYATFISRYRGSHTFQVVNMATKGRTR